MHMQTNATQVHLQMLYNLLCLSPTKLIIYVHFSQKWARVTFGLWGISKLNLVRLNVAKFRFPNLLHLNIMFGTSYAQILK